MMRFNDSRDFMKQLDHLYYKYQQQEKQKKKFQTFIDAAAAYQQHMIYAPSPFYYSFFDVRNFVYTKNRLYYINLFNQSKKFYITEDNFSSIFKHLSVNKNSTVSLWIKKSCTLLWDVHKSLSEILTPYLKAINEYKFKCNYPNPELFINCEKYFSIVKKNLVFHNQYVPTSFLFLHDTNISKCFQLMNHPVPPKTLLKKLLRFIKRNAESKELPIDQKLEIICSKYALFIQLRHLNFLIYYKNQNFYQEVLPPTIIPQFHFVKCDTSCKLTSNICDFLYKFTNGNLTTLYNLSVVLSNIFSPISLTPKLFIVIAPPKIRLLFITFIEALLENRIAFFNSLKELLASSISSEESIDLLNLEYNGIKAIMVSNCKPITDETKIKMFKKMIQYKSVSYNSSILTKVYFTNTVPIICFPKTHTETNFLINNFPHIVLKFDHTDQSNLLEQLPNSLENIGQNSNNIDTLSFTEQELSWLRLTLSLYGLKCLADGTLPPSSGKRSVPKTVIPHDTIISDFINTCCIVSKQAQNQFTYADELYSAYKEFFTFKYGTLFLKRTQFNNKLKLTGNYLYRRPHISRDIPNKYAFTNILLKDDWKDCIKKLRSELIEESAFKEELFKMENCLTFVKENLENHPG